MDAANATTEPRRRGRPTAGLAVSGAWMPAVLAVVGWWALPMGRAGRPFTTIDPDLYAVAIGHPLLWLALLASLAALGLSLLPMPTARRADLVDRKSVV